MTQPTQDRAAKSRERGPVGPRRPRAAQRQRAVQEGRRPAQRARPHREHLRQAGLRQHRQGRPARPVPLVGPLHPAQAGLRRHLDRRREHRHARGRVLHAAGPQRRRRADRRGAAHPRRASPPSSPATPPTSPTGRTSSTTGSGSRTCRRSGGASTRSACRPPRPAATARASCSARRWPANRSTRCIDATPAIDEIVRRYVGKPEYSNLPRKFKTAISRSAGRGARDQRRRVHRGRTTPSTAPASTCGSAAGCRPTRCWPSGSAPGCRSTRCPTSGKRVVSVVPRLRLPAAAVQGPAEVPDQGLGRREVPRSSRDRVPQASADRRARARPGGAPDRPRRGAATASNGLNAVGVAPIAGRVSGTILTQGRRPGRGGGLGPDPVHARTRS